MHRQYFRLQGQPLCDKIIFSFVGATLAVALLLFVAGALLLIRAGASPAPTGIVCLKIIISWMWFGITTNPSMSTFGKYSGIAFCPDLIVIL
jgi:hypothetical protein